MQVGASAVRDEDRLRCRVGGTPLLSSPSWLLASGALPLRFGPPMSASCRHALRAGGSGSSPENKTAQLSLGSVLLSGWRDSNPRPPRPERGALATALHPEIVRANSIGLVLPCQSAFLQTITESTKACSLSFGLGFRRKERRRKPRLSLIIERFVQFSGVKQVLPRHSA